MAGVSHTRQSHDIRGFWRSFRETVFRPQKKTVFAIDAQTEISMFRFVSKRKRWEAFFRNGRERCCSFICSTERTRRPRSASWASSSWISCNRSSIRTCGDPNGRGLPPWPAFANAKSKVQYLGDPITVGGVANMNGLDAFDAVYTTVRGKPFAAR